MEEGKVCDLKWTEVKGVVCELNINGKLRNAEREDEKALGKRL